MNNEFDRALRDVAGEVFESLAFMLLMPDDAAEDEDAHSDRIAFGVQFSGPFSGGIVLKVSEGVLPPLAVNMLGLDDDEQLHQDHQYDAAKELLNVICGNLLPIIAGHDAVFDVQRPQLLISGQLPETWNALSEVSRAELTLDTGRAELAIFLSDGANVISPAHAAGDVTE